MWLTKIEDERKISRTELNDLKRLFHKFDVSKKPNKFLLLNCDFHKFRYALLMLTLENWHHEIDDQLQVFCIDADDSW